MKAQLNSLDESGFVTSETNEIMNQSREQSRTISEKYAVNYY